MKFVIIERIDIINPESMITKIIPFAPNNIASSNIPPLLDFKKNLIQGGGAIIGVQGANFSEGIDLPGELLKAVAIVGVPLAPPDLRQKAVIDYYETNFGNGWSYGYTFPAMNRALQAAGRCIRSKDDRGVIAFLDKQRKQPVIIVPGQLHLHSVHLQVHLPSALQTHGP